MFGKNCHARVTSVPIVNPILSMRLAWLTDIWVTIWSVLNLSYDSARMSRRCMNGHSPGIKKLNCANIRLFTLDPKGEASLDTH